MLKKRLVFILTAALCLAVGAAVALLAVQEPEIARRRLPDGAVVSLVGVTKGKRHRMDTRSPWDRAVAMLLAGNRPERRVRHHDTSEESVTFWVRIRGKGTPDAALRGNRLPVLVDEHGCSFGATEGPVWSLRGDTSTTDTLHAFSFSSFPRRPGRMELRFWEPPGDRVALSLAAENLPGRVPADWKPEPYPIQRAGQDFRLRVDGLDYQKTSGLSYTTVRGAYPDPEHPGEEWEPAWGSVSDSGGNRMEGPSFSGPGPRDWAIYGLCARDSAWKVGLHLARPAETRVSPDFEWVLRDVPLPEYGRDLRLQRSVTSGGVKLVLTEVRSNTATGNRQGKMITLLGLNVSVPDAGPGLRVTLKEAFAQPAPLLFRNAGLPLSTGLDSPLTRVATRNDEWRERFSIPLPWGARG